MLAGLGRRVGNEGVRYSEQVAQNSLNALNIVLNEEYFIESLISWNDNLMAYYYNSLHLEDKLLKKLYSSFMTRLVDEMLMKVDRMTMAHSLEARVPLLDHKVVEFAFALPSNMKLRSSGQSQIGKYIFKKAMKPYLPEEIIYREKKGFDIPVEKWMKGAFLDKVIERIKDGYLSNSNILDQRGLDNLISDIRRGNTSYYNLLMLLFTFETWADVYENKFGKLAFH